MAMPQLLDRALLRVSGPDARTFLNSLLTRDVGGERVVYTALLSPQGKVLTDMFAWDDGENGIVLDVPPDRAQALERKLSLYKLRAQVAIEQITGLAAIFYGTGAFDAAAPDPRFPNGELGWRALLPMSSGLEALEDGELAFDTRRLAVGVPNLARDAEAEEVFAGEALLDELNGVDFQKGCFVGQENVSRMKRRATTRKKFCPVVFEGEPIAFGTPVLAGEAEIGSVRTGAAGRAIALLRLDRALDAVAAGKTLTAAGREIRLDPPSWLILPQREDGA